MISEEDKARIVEIGKRFRASKIVLFGSSISPSAEARDIDLAVEGVAPSRFFEFYGDLIFGLSKPVDLVDPSKGSRFTRLILAEGVALYG